MNDAANCRRCRRRLDLCVPCASVYLGISTESLRRAVKARKIRRYRYHFGGLRFRQADLDAYKESCYGYETKLGRGAGATDRVCSARERELARREALTALGRSA